MNDLLERLRGLEEANIITGAYTEAKAIRAARDEIEYLRGLMVSSFPLREVERLRDEARAERENKVELVLALEAKDARLAEAERLLREVREDAPTFGMPTDRIDAFLRATDSATDRETDKGTAE